MNPHHHHAQLMPQQKLHHYSTEQVQRLATKYIRMKEDPIDWKLVLYYIVGTIVYYVLSGPIVYFFSSTSAMEYLPQVDTSKF